MNDYRIGILGGGQLGKMLCLAGGEMNLDISILEKEEGCPAGPYCRHFIKGDITSYDDVLSFGRNMDAISIEIEKVNINALKVLENEGITVCPSAQIIETIQDKGVQKQFLKDNHIPTSNFEYFDSEISILEALDVGNLSYPFVQKLRTEGYDGKGVLVCNDRPECGFFSAPSIIEKKVDIDKELAVIVCRNSRNEMAIYDPVEMVFDPIANLLDYQIGPARIPSHLVQDIHQIAYEIAEKLDLVGILAIELFLTPSGDILVNEMAPRPHNSGHHTIEACTTSQYENLLRILADLPIGHPGTIHSSLLINLLGSDGYTGSCRYGGIEEILKIKGSHIHLYGKTMTKPKRKMGHVNVISDDVDSYSDIVQTIKSHFSTSNSH